MDQKAIAVLIREGIDSFAQQAREADIIHWKATGAVEFGRQLLARLEQTEKPQGAGESSPPAATSLQRKKDESAEGH